MPNSGGENQNRETRSSTVEAKVKIAESMDLARLMMIMLGKLEPRQ
jgi:hypothetical protein